MTRGKITPKLVEEWKKLEDSLGYRAIARLYGVTVQTIEYWLVPGFKERKMTHRRLYRQKLRERKVKMRNYQKKYRDKPEIKTQRRDYDLKYKKVVRHIDAFLPKILNNKTELSLSEMSSGIDKLTGIHLKENTLQNILNKYENREPPLIRKTKADKYLYLPFLQ